jgi:hypothetical protein
VGGSTSSYATSDIALRVSGALKPHHHDKVKTPSVGISDVTGLKINILNIIAITGNNKAMQIRPKSS